MVRILQLRNPLVYKEWNGKSTDKSNKWNDEAYQGLKVTTENYDCGIF